MQTQTQPKEIPRQPGAGASASPRGPAASPVSGHAPGETLRELQAAVRLHDPYAASWPSAAFTGFPGWNAYAPYAPHATAAAPPAALGYPWATAAPFAPYAPLAPFAAPFAPAQAGGFSPFGFAYPGPQALLPPAGMNPWTQVPTATSAALAGAGARAFAPHAGAAAGFLQAPNARIPPIDVVDEGSEYVCQVELPGVKAENVDLYCFERSVLVSAQSGIELDAGALVQSERGTFITHRRVIPLPSEIQSGNCRAALRDGVLTVNLPKATPTEGPRRVQVQ